MEDLEDILLKILTTIYENTHLIKPRKIIVFASDGIVTKAKINQQQTRRFRLVKDYENLKKSLAMAMK
jgi:5'-3' exonuclease